MIPFNIIINADDFGASPKRNFAIQECFRKEIINSTSIMPNMPAFLEAVTLAENQGFKSRIGLHACITEGKPLTDLSGTSLVNKYGFFQKKLIYKPTRFYSRSLRYRIRREIEAQLNELYKFEINPTHINSHHCVHELPWLLPIFIFVAKKHKIKLRVSQTWMDGKNFLKPVYRIIVNKVYRHYDLNFTDYFETLEIFVENKSEIKNSNKLTEIMVHPTMDINNKITDDIDKSNLEERILRIFGR